MAASSVSAYGSGFVAAGVLSARAIAVVSSVTGAAGIEAGDSSRAGTGLLGVLNAGARDSRSTRLLPGVRLRSSLPTPVIPVSALEHHRFLDEAAVRIGLGIRAGTVDDRPPASGEQQSGLEGLETNPGVQPVLRSVPFFVALPQLPASCLVLKHKKLRRSPYMDLFFAVIGQWWPFLYIQDHLWLFLYSFRNGSA